MKTLYEIVYPRGTRAQFIAAKYLVKCHPKKYRGRYERHGDTLYLFVYRKSFFGRYFDERLYVVSV